MTFFEKNEENLEAIVFALTQREKTTIAIGVYDCDDTRDKAISYITQQFRDQQTLSFDLFGQKINSLLAFLRPQLPKNTEKNLPIVHIINLDPLLFTSENHKVISSPLVAQINMERELLFHEVEGLIVLWLTRGGYNRLRIDAPDFMDWVTASFTFENDGDTLNQRLSFELPKETIDDRSKAEIHQLQEKAEQLEQRTHKFQQGTRLTIKDKKEYFNLLLSLIESYMNLHDLNNAQSTLNTTYTLAKENNLAGGFEFGLLLINWGDTEGNLGNLDKALALFEEAYQHFLLLEDEFNQAVCLERLGETHSRLGNLGKALIFFEKFHVLEKELHKSFPNNLNLKNGLALSYSRLGDTNSLLGNLDKALTFFEEYVKLSKVLHDNFPTNVEFKHSLAVSYSKLGDTHNSLGNLDKALTFFKEFNKLEKELHEAYPTNISSTNGLAVSYWQLGEINKILNNTAAMLDAYEKSNQLLKSLFNSSSQNVQFKSNLAESYHSLGQSYINVDKVQAKSYLVEAEILWKELVHDAPQYLDFQRFLEQTQKELQNL